MPGISMGTSPTNTVPRIAKELESLVNRSGSGTVRSSKDLSWWSRGTEPLSALAPTAS